MPNYDLNYPKKGFSVPLEKIFKNEIQNYSLNLFNQEKLYEDNFLKKNEIINIFKDHQSNKNNNSFYSGIY